MDKLKANRVVALKQVGIPKKDVEEFRKSSREFFVQYTGRNREVITTEILEKIHQLIIMRRTMGVEIAGVILEDNLDVIFLFYVDNDPMDAFYEKNSFASATDFEMELDRQIAPNFIPDMSDQKHVICINGTEAFVVPCD